MSEDTTYACMCPDSFVENAVPVDYCLRHGEASRLRQELDEARARLGRVDDALRSAGIEYPLGAAGVTDLAAMANGRLEELQAIEDVLAEHDKALDEARAERDRLRALFDKLLALVPEEFGDEAPLPELPANGARPDPIAIEELVYLWVRYRLDAIPDAEPAPGVPVDTEATP